ncbi:hypothetical protein IF919_004737, partial [Salmonella enterica subsp. enterica serovar Heidelberg]|nr:hypothetical protein [Salmonella enterica subsp. enterica serovar Heidelberg]
TVLDVILSLIVIIATMNGDAIPSVARTISDISDRFSLADPLLIADIALNITNVLLSIRKQHKSMYNIGFPQPRSDGFPVILHKFDSTDAFKISLP